MQPVQPIDTLALFPVLHTHLIELLRSLNPEDWHRPTVCKGWSVKDIASHLADGHFRRIALYRDAYFPPAPPAVDSYQSLVHYLNQLNQDWVVATRRVSPGTLIDWLEQTGPVVHQLFRQLPPADPAIFSVAWAGEQTSANWFHIAREYTELWHHQQQIRLAVDQVGPLFAATLYHPLLDTFMRALPHTYRHIPAPRHTLIRFIITGSGGGEWYLYRDTDRWTLMTNVDDATASSVVVIDGPMSWRLFTNGLSPEEARPYLSIDGDQALGLPVLKMLSVMA